MGLHGAGPACTDVGVIIAPTSLHTRPSPPSGGATTPHAGASASAAGRRAAGVGYPSCGKGAGYLAPPPGAAAVCGAVYRRLLLLFGRAFGVTARSRLSCLRVGVAVHPKPVPLHACHYSTHAGGTCSLRSSPPTAPLPAPAVQPWLARGGSQQPLRAAAWRWRRAFEAAPGGRPSLRFLAARQSQAPPLRGDRHLGA